MAGTKVCPNCGAKNPSSNRFCEDCGYDMNKFSTPSSLKVALYCPNGHTVSDTSLGFCDVCGAKLTDERDVIKAPEPVDKDILGVDAIGVPAAPRSEFEGKKCPSCGAINPESAVFCEECGKELTVDFEPAPSSAVSPRDVSRELPDIPDIMRTLTNNDMKR